MMIRKSAHKLVRQFQSQTSQSSAILNAIFSSSSDVGHLAIRPDGDTSTCVSSTWGLSNRHGGRDYSASSRGFRSLGALQQGIAEPLDAVQLPSDIVHDDLVITRAQHLKEKPVLDVATLKFGDVYSDHMLQITWTEGAGWAAPSIEPFGPLQIDPCAQVLQYGMNCFEGMKAYKSKDGVIRMFRPDMNMNRLSRSAARLTLPAFDKEALLDCIKSLLRVERDWIPSQEGFSLYIRPTFISTYPHLGVGPTKSATIFCILAPVGPYFPEGLKPIKLFVDSKHVRAFPGGVGDSKVGGNYSPTVLPLMKAIERGCSQVLYVLEDGVDGGAIGESGAMNIFFLLKNGDKMELATPDLSGVILPGVTRDSVLTLTRSFGDIQVSERRLSWNEIDEADKKGNILEVFGTGTACMVQPIKGLVMESGREIKIPFDEEAACYWTQKPGGSSLQEPKRDEPFNLCGRLTRAIMDIQYGHTNSDWSVPI